MLVLRHRRPIIHPYPNKYSHDLPRFSYDPVSGNISITFTSDPSYPDPSSKVREPPTPPEAADPVESRSYLAASFQITNGSSSSIELSVPEREPTRATSNSPPLHTQARADQPMTLQPPPTSRRRVNESWRNRVYLLTALPSRKPKTLLDDAAAFFSNTASILTTPLAINTFSFPFSSSASGATSGSGVSHTGGSGGGSAVVARQHIESGEYDLRENEIVEEERAEAEEVDDDPDPARRVKVYGFRPRDLVGAGNPRARERRRWEIVPIRKERRRF